MIYGSDCGRIDTAFQIVFAQFKRKEFNMAKMSFKAENKAADNESFPKLKLDQDESGRISCFEEPEVGFVHNIRAPKIVQGEVQYKRVETKNGPEMQMEFDFIGNPICLGDFNTLQDRGIDPKNCPACKAAQEAPDMFAPPKRRFAMHVFQYTTNGTKNATRNFQGSVKIWAFTDQKFNELIDLMEEAPNKDLRNIDIILGPCENKMYQKFKMVHSNQVKWKENETSQSQFEDIIAENQAKDLSKFLGRTTKKDWLEDDLDKVRARWRVVNGQKDEKPNDSLAGVERNLDAGLANLLDEPKVTPAVKAEDSKPAVQSAGSDDDGPVDFDKLLADL